MFTERESKIIEASIAYYNGNPIMSDAEWDAELKALKYENPTSKVLQGVGWGYSPKNSELEVKSHWLTNLHGFDKIFVSEELSSLSSISGYYTPKYDGASVTLYYQNGDLKLALTRGDGTTGSDVTDKLRYVVPNQIDPDIKVVSGEWIMSKTELSKLGNSRLSHRNIAVGALMRKTYDPKEISNFDFVAYRIEKSNLLPGYITEGRAFVTHALSNCGFNVAPYKIATPDDTFKSVMSKFNSDVDYNLDGIVFESAIIYDSKSGTYNYQDEIAYKYNSQREVTTVTKIDWNFTRTGKYVPTVEYDPVYLSGAMCSRATAFNAKYILDNKIGVGSEVVVTRSGEVIPYITESTPSPSAESEMPKVCACGHPLQWSGVDLVCLNPNCSSKLAHQLYHYIDTLSGQYIKGVASNIIDTVIAINQWTTPCGIYLSDKGVCEAKLSQVYSPLTSSYQLACRLLGDLFTPKPFLSVLVALGISGISYGVAGKVSAILENYIKSETPVEFWRFQQIPSIGDTIESYLIKNADSIINLYKVIENSVGFSEEVQGDESDKLKVCISGKLSSGRTKLQFYKEYEFSIVESSVQDADYLISSKLNSAKTDIARQLGVPIVSEDEFIKEVL